jgi:hypothetical protein
LLWLPKNIFSHAFYQETMFFLLLSGQDIFVFLLQRQQSVLLFTSFVNAQRGHPNNKFFIRIFFYRQILYLYVLAHCSKTQKAKCFVLIKLRTEHNRLSRLLDYFSVKRQTLLRNRSRSRIVMWFQLFFL